MTRNEIIKAANYCSPIYGKIGGYVCTDGEWCLCTTPKKFQAYLESLGFEIKRCYSTSRSNAVAETKDGYMIAYNGNCSLLK